MAAKVTKARDEGRRLLSAWGGVDDREIKVWGESFLRSCCLAVWCNERRGIEEFASFWLVGGCIERAGRVGGKHSLVC